MKRIAVLALALLVFALPAGATPPKQVSLVYNRGAKTLTVTADHYTLMPSVHFIKTIVVEVDGKEAVTKTLTSQTSAQQQIVSIPLPDVKPGSKINVTASCSLFGSGTAEIVAP